MKIRYRYFRAWEDNKDGEEFIILVDNLSINGEYINSISNQNGLAFIRVTDRKRVLINFQEQARGFSKYFFIADEESLPEDFFFGDFLIPGQSGIFVKDNKPVSVISAPESLFEPSQPKVIQIDDSSTLGKIIKKYGKYQNLIIDYD